MSAIIQLYVRSLKVAIIYTTIWF